jgi:hypothetical protein
MPHYVDDPENPGQHIDVLLLQRRDPLKVLFPDRLEGFWRRDLWTRREALQLLAGYNPNSTSWTESSEGFGQFSSGGIGYLDSMTELQLRYAGIAHPLHTQCLEHFWMLSEYAKGGSLDEKKSPQAWVEWANSKSFTPYWLQYLPIDNHDTSTSPVPRPGGQQRHQEDEIKRVLIECGYDLKALSRGTPGNPGAKKSARDKLPIFNKGVFNKAWKRLRENDEIRDA